jgi:predicted exporter
MALSQATEFIENSDANAALGADARKQDCELKALSRLMPNLRREYPQLRLCLTGDGLYACGRTLQLAKDHDCHYAP